MSSINFNVKQTKSEPPPYQVGYKQANPTICVDSEIKTFKVTVGSPFLTSLVLSRD